jgi:hypothetical protein
MGERKLKHNYNEDGVKCQSSAIDKGQTAFLGPVILEPRIGDNAPIENRSRTNAGSYRFPGPMIGDRLKSPPHSFRQIPGISAAFAP